MFLNIFIEIFFGLLFKIETESLHIWQLVLKNSWFLIPFRVSPLFYLNLQPNFITLHLSFELLLHSLKKLIMLKFKHGSPIITTFYYSIWKVVISEDKQCCQWQQVRRYRVKRVSNLWEGEKQEEKSMKAREVKRNRWREIRINR